MLKKLKIGILVNSQFVKKYEYEILEKLQNSNFCDIELIIEKANSNSLDKSFYIKHFLYLVYKKIDQFLFNRRINYLKQISIKEFTNSIDKLSVEVNQKKYFDYFKDDDISKIKEYKLDVILRFGFNILKSDILHVAKYGIWSFHHADNNINRGGPPAFWEVMNKNLKTGVILQRLNDDLDNGFIIDRTWTMTDSASVFRNLNIISWKSHIIMIRNLEKLYNNRDIFFNIEAKELSFYSHPLYMLPTNKEMILNSIGILSNYIKLFNSKFLDNKRWHIRYKENINKSFEMSLFRYKTLKAPSKDLFWADPFVIDKDNISFLFFEEYDYSLKKGHLSVMEYDLKTKSFLTPKIIIDEKYHLSYPFIFEKDSEYYIIPESHENKTIDLYKCIKFPYCWKKEKTLLGDIIAVDTTPFFYNNKWWIFTNVIKEQDFPHHDDMYLYYCDDILNDKWISHPKNPIVSDVSNARCAGKIFEHNGDIYRPSQNCEGHYGKSININKIVILNEFEYKEKKIDEITSDFDDDLDSIHTFNFSNNMSVVDGK